MTRRTQRPIRSCRSRPAPRARAAPSVALFVALALAACGDAGDDVTTTVGDSWFDRLDQVAVLEYPRGNLPSDVAAWLDGAAETSVETIASSGWAPLRDVPAAYLEGFALDPDTVVWEAADAPPIRTVPGPPRILNAGRAMTALAGASPTDPGRPVPLWWDRDAALVVWWEPELKKLRSLSVQRPGELLVEAASAAGGKQLRFEQPARGGAGAPAAEQLDLRVTLDDVTRRAMLLPAPGRLSLPIGTLGASGFSFSVGLVDHALSLEDGEPRQTDGLSDGALCAVEVEVGGLRKRVWSQELRPGEPWRSDSIEFAGWRDSGATLHLVSEPGPGGDTDFDYVVWSDLRLTGLPAPDDPRPTIVLVLVDTLRSDRLGCYGYEVETSPRLDAWAEQHAVVYEDSVSDASWTLPSAVSILTGRSVHHHRVGDGRVAIGEDMTLLAERLSAEGYATFGICEGGYVRPQFGFGRGFDTFIVQPDQEPDWDPAIDFLASLDGARPAFVFLQTYIVHQPFAADDGRLPLDPPYDGWLLGQPVDFFNVVGPYMSGKLELSDEDRRYIQHLYDTDVRRMDDVVADVLEDLERRFADDELLVIVTSDHGDEHFEHGGMDHGHSLHAELLNVPLIARLPGGTAGRSDAPVSTLDIVPTILDAVGLEIPADLPGRVLGGALPERHVRVGGNRDGQMSVQYDGRKLLQAMGEDGLTAALYDLRADPTEQQSVLDENPQIVSALRERLAAFLAEHRQQVAAGADQESVELDQDAIDQLRALGYLGDH
ncbi:MAG: sulfatase [Planctomycetota bacterium]|jgi:arylsulfatase A-like enzyme